MEVWACQGCERIGRSPSDLLRQGCEGKPERFVPEGQQWQPERPDDVPPPRLEVGHWRDTLQGAPRRCDHCAGRGWYASYEAREDDKTITWHPCEVCGRIGIKPGETPLQGTSLPDPKPVPPDSDPPGEREQG